MRLNGGCWATCAVTAKRKGSSKLLQVQSWSARDGDILSILGVGVRRGPEGDEVSWYRSR